MLGATQNGRTAALRARTASRAAQRFPCARMHIQHGNISKGSSASRRVVRPPRRATGRDEGLVGSGRQAARCPVNAGALETTGQTYHGAKRRGKRAEARGEPRGVQRTALDKWRFLGARPPRRRRVDHKRPRHRLRRPQNGENEQPEGKGQAAGALGESSQRDKQGNDAPQRVNLPYCGMRVHVQPFDIPGHCGAGSGRVDRFGAKSWKVVMSLRVASKFVGKPQQPRIPLG